MLSALTIMALKGNLKWVKLVSGDILDTKLNSMMIIGIRRRRTEGEHEIEFPLLLLLLFDTTIVWAADWGTWESFQGRHED